MTRLFEDTFGVMPAQMTNQEIIVALAKLGSELSYEDGKVVLNIKSIGLVSRFDPHDNIIQDGFQPLIAIAGNLPG
jgi:hypothetical protein